MEKIVIKPINNLDNTSSCMISKKNFDSINKLYKFNQIKDGNKNYYYNKKRNSYVVKECYDNIFKNTVYYLDKSWYRVELNATNSETLIKVGETTPELFYIVESYKQEKEKEKHKHGSLLDSVEKGLDELLKLC